MALLDEMTALAQAGAAAVLAAGHRFSDRAALLLGRGDPALEGAAADRLDRTAAALRAASDEDERERVRAEHAEQWRVEFAHLLTEAGAAERTHLMGELRLFAREFGTAAGEAAGPVMSGNTFHGPTNVQVGHHSHQEIHFGSAG